MIQDLLTNKKYLFASGANTELRAQRNLNRRAALLNGALVGNVRTEQFGVSARVYENGVYGFSSTAEYTDETVKDVLKAASENAAFLAKHAGKGKGPHKAMAPDRIATAYDLNDLEQRVYIEFAQALDNYIASKYPDLVSRTVVITCDSMEKLLCVSNGCDGHSIIPRSYIYVMMTAMGADGKPVEPASPWSSTRSSAGAAAPSIGTIRGPRTASPRSTASTIASSGRPRTACTPRPAPRP